MQNEQQNESSNGSDTETPLRDFPGRLAFYHPTASGGGAAVRFELSPPRGTREGCYFMELARQKSLAMRSGPERHAATFDWTTKVTVKLGFLDVCQLLTVLEGKAEQAGGSRGLFHETAENSTMIALRRQTEPAGYALEVSRKPKQAEATPLRLRLVLGEAEAIGLRCIFQQTLAVLIFGAVPGRGNRPPPGA